MRRIVKLLSRRHFLSPENVKRFFVGSQEDMNFDGTPAKAPSASGRRITPPTPQQSTQLSFESTPLQMEVEDQEFGACGQEYDGEHRWTARDGTVVAKMEQYLKESDNMKLEIVELELLLGQEHSYVEVRKILMIAKVKKGSPDLPNTFSMEGPSDFLVVSALRWEIGLEEKRRREEEYVEHWAMWARQEE